MRTFANYLQEQFLKKLKYVNWTKKQVEPDGEHVEAMDELKSAPRNEGLVKETTF